MIMFIDFSIYIYMCIVYRVCDSVSVCVYVYVCFIISSLWFVFQMSPNKTKTNLMCVLSKEPYHRSLVEPTCIWIDYFTVAFLKSSEKRNHAAAAALLLLFLVKHSTFGMDFLCQVYQDFRQLFDMCHNYPHHFDFDFVSHSNVSLITLAVSDLMAHRAVLNEMSLRPPNQYNSTH